MRINVCALRRMFVESVARFGIASSSANSRRIAPSRRTRYSRAAARARTPTEPAVCADAPPASREKEPPTTGGGGRGVVWEIVRIKAVSWGGGGESGRWEGGG